VKIGGLQQGPDAGCQAPDDAHTSCYLHAHDLKENPAFEFCSDLPVVDVPPQHIVLGRGADEIRHGIAPVTKDGEQPLLLPARLILATCDSNRASVRTSLCLAECSLMVVQLQQVDTALVYWVRKDGASIAPAGSLWKPYHCILPPPTSLETKYLPLPRNTRYLHTIEH
jgi:hypothetical protein